MSSFQQPCPNCAAKLEMPSEVRGRSAVCPRCGHQFVAETLSSSTEASESGPSDRGVAQEHTPGSELPPIRPPRRIEPVTIEAVIADAREVYSTRKRPLLWPFLLPSLLVLLGIVLPMAVISELAATNPWSAVAWSALLAPLFILLTGYTVWFAMNLAVDVCDAGIPDDPDHPPPIRSWWIPDGRVLLNVLTLVAAAGAVAATLLTFSVVLFQVGRNLPATELRLLMMAIAVAGGVALAIAAAMRFWPLLPLAMEGQPPWTAIREALAVTRVNQMTSFMLVTINTVLLGIGFSFLGLGLPIAIPLACLICEVASRRMLGRRVPATDAPPVTAGPATQEPR